MIHIIKESFDYDNLLKHIKHIEEYKDDTRFEDTVDSVISAINNFSRFYNAVADELASKNAGKSISDVDNIVGYIRQDGAYAKYNKKTHDFVVYNPTNGKTITLHKKTWEQYLRQMKGYFKEELPENKE